MTNDKTTVVRWWKNSKGRIGCDTATYVEVPEGDDRAIRIEGREGWWFLLHSTHSDAFPSPHKVEPTGETITGTDPYGRAVSHPEYAVVPPPPGDPYWNIAEWELAKGFKDATAEEALRQADKDRKTDEALSLERLGPK